MKLSRTRLAIGAGTAVVLAGAGAFAAASASGNDAAKSASGQDKQQILKVQRAAQSQVKAFAARSVEGAAPQSPQSGPLKGKELPIEKYLVGSVDGAKARQAEELLIIKCMADYGVAYTPEQNPVDSAPAKTSANDANIERRYGIVDVEEAKRGGVERFAESEKRLELSDEQMLLLRTTGTDGKPFTGELRGKPTPKGGCRTQAMNELGGDLRAEAADNIAGKTFVASQKDPSVVALKAERDACLKGKGVPAEQPGVQRSKDQAVTEAQCAGTVGLAQKWFAIETSMQNKLIGEQCKVLDEEKARNQAIVKKAETVLAQARQAG
ncbi:hypothetical protein [Streptomyces caatingaensis]|uniref:Uncharacterized protein n=1 Tax=Streptomyces caatingaensis TaxID=1678637 RepID=A0A0K9XBA1_9ACTN|nr:hypothetical protein [Streptomyces caatingaensis]KNB49942.1 hypothetical protein AC230_24755 [Streptomyces caatingaensis]